MSYLTLAEAAQYVNNKTGQEVEPAALLRAGVLGKLPIVAYFDSLMRNLSAHENNEVLGHLVVPQRYLATIENEGQAIVEGAFSLDSKACYAPFLMRTRDQLRVLVSDLDKFIPCLIDTTQQTNARAAKGGAVPVTRQSDEIPGKMPNTAIGKLAIKAAFQIECKSGKCASANQVIAMLVEWIETEPILLEKIPHGIRWMTSNNTEADFCIEACGKALTKWNSTRP